MKLSTTLDFAVTAAYILLPILCAILTLHTHGAHWPCHGSSTFILLFKRLISEVCQIEGGGDVSTPIMLLYLSILESFNPKFSIFFYLGLGLLDILISVRTEKRRGATGKRPMKGSPAPLPAGLPEGEHEVRDGLPLRVEGRLQPRHPPVLPPGDRSR